MYYQSHKKERSLYSKKYRENNREKLIKYSKNYNKEYLSVPENRMKNNLRFKKWAENNKSRIRIRQKIYKQSKLKDCNFKLQLLLRNRLRDALKGKLKVGSAIKDLGCSVAELKVWLEQQFYPNPETGEQMSWENHSFYGWHIDHIIPLSSFDLTDRQQLKKACHWFNLQPLWVKENLIKNARI